MIPKENEKVAMVLEKTTANKQVCLVVDGCKIKMNFPEKPEVMALNDIKRMMLGGIKKV